MSQGRRRLPRRSRVLLRRGAVIGILCALLAVSGSFAVVTHRASLRLPAGHHSTAGASRTTSTPDTPLPTALPADVRFARTTFNLWSRPAMRARSWWRALAPHLSAQAKQEIAGTDPAYLPAAAVTGEPVVLQRANRVFTRVRLPTQDGDFVVDVVRSTPGSPWRLDRIGFPVARG